MRISIYPHQFLLNLAHYHLEVVQGKVARGEEDAIALDCASCLLMLAFSVEAILNFVGSKKVPEWVERMEYPSKMKRISTLLGFQLDLAVEPYKTLADLKKVRNDMAHAQPIEKTASVSSKEELSRAMHLPWEDLLTPDYAEHAYRQVEVFEDQLLALADISPSETLTRAFGAWKGREE